MEVLRFVREQVANLGVKKRISRTKKSNMPPAEYYRLKSDDMICTYSEAREKCISGLRVIDF